MFDSNQLNKVFRSHDASRLAAVLGNDGLRHPEVARKFVMALRQSSSLALQIADVAKEGRRELMVQKCRELLSACPDKAVLQDFENHVQDAGIVEHGYREIFKTMRESEIWKRPPAEQAWGIIHRAEREFAHLQGEINKELVKLAAEKNPSLDPRQLRIKGENGNSVRPDAIINGIVRNVGDTLITLAYVHGWFDENTGALVLPPEVKVDEAIAFQAGTFSLVASQWRCLEHAWDRSRLAKARFRLREQEFPIKQGGTRQCTVLEVQAAGRAELMDRIALNRLEQVFFQSQMNMHVAGVGRKNPNATTTDPVPLAKVSNPSPEEILTLEVLDGNFFIPVYDDTTVVAGLTWKAWVRGYAFYERKAQDTAGNPIFSCLRLSENDLISGLISVGLSNEQARVFVGHTTFGQSAADLFDTPLLKASDGSYCFFAPAYQAPTLGVILLSRISSLNRRRDQHGVPANDCQIEDKGKFFERRVLNLFIKAGVPAHGFKYTVDGTEYDCDVAALIDDALFIFECKNRSLPMGHLPSLHYFILALEEAQDQVKRIAGQLKDHPEIVRQHFGANARWTRLVPVVLHALPWSFGCRDGVYIYDASALSHLMEKGAVTVFAVGNSEAGHVRRPCYRYALRKGNTPTAAELEREMGNPNQLRLQALGWDHVARPMPVSDRLVVSLPEWSQKPCTVEEQLRALGSSPEEAARIASEMVKDFPKGGKRI